LRDLPNACKQQTPIASITIGRACAPLLENSDLVTAENTTVNRPFSAFAAMMTLLALAMFAVSSTSRSTSVQPERVQSSGFRVQRGDRGQETGNREQRTLVGGRTTGLSGKATFVKTGDTSLVVAATSGLRSLLVRDCSLGSALWPARIVAAENTLARIGSLTPVDCQSHYDAYYDFVVYGIKEKSPEFAPAVVEPEAAAAGLGGELDTIFQELASRRSREPLPQAGALKLDIKTIRWKAIAAAVSEWVQYHARQAVELQILEKKGRPASAARVGWADYAEFVDGACGRKIANLEATRTSGDENGVRSGDWLRHSAAAGLYQMSLLLRAAAHELEGAGEETLSAVSQ